jgi:hypothetical protein
LRRVGVAGVLAALLALPAFAASGCGSTKSANPTSAPTVSLWVSGTAREYRQVGAGVKLALADRGGRAGQFRVNYAGRQVSDDPARAEADALANARTSLQDTQASAVITDAPAAAARPAITLLNEAGISAVSVGDGVSAAEACSAASDIYPAGHQTAVVVDSSAGSPSASWSSRFRSALGFAPNERAWRAYQGAAAVLASLGAPGVATGDDPPRLDRDALAAQLVRAHGGC